MSNDVAGHPMVDFTQMKTFAEDPLVLDVALEARRRGLLIRAAPWFVAVAPPLVTTPR